MSATRRPHTVSPWEWVAAALGAALVLGAAGLLLHDALTAPRTPPLVELSVEGVVPGARGYLVEFRALNTGEGTAAALVVEGRLSEGGTALETAEATIDYVPGGASRRGGLYFSRDPRRHELELRPRGFAEP